MFRPLIGLVWMILVVAPGTLSEVRAEDDGVVFPVAGLEVVIQGRAGESVFTDSLRGVVIPFTRLPDGALAARREGVPEHHLPMSGFSGGEVHRVYASGVR
ncbi:MAG: hypothetical protein K8E66_08110, partial [Phycisphaerales bacterium]|nr:hypothetical protein [Phycisphaerales bacterium]